MKNIKKYMVIVMSISLLGELYFYPFDGNFRFSVGVVAFSLVFLLTDNINMVLLSICTGVSVLILRFIIEYFSAADMEITNIITSNFPSSVYYILYGFSACFFNVKKLKKNPFLMVTTLFSIDVICNMVESFIRSNLNLYLFKLIIIIALLRSFVSYGIFFLIDNQNSIIKKTEHQKRYIQLNTLVSNIQAELFYLKKSTHDIEDVMNKSFALYKSNKNNSTALDIARDVHEIKKDYHRVLSGFESFLKEFEKNESMSFNDLSFIIEGNSKRYIDDNTKEINLKIIINDNIYIKKYYSIFTILNNLIINSIDAIKGTGNIKVVQHLSENYLTLTVTDDGEGIDDDIIPYIFNPGFTTKYDEKSGKSSTGIGLSHVKNIVDELDGKIEVESICKKTKFTVMLPVNSLKI